MPIEVQYGSPMAPLGAAYRAGELQGDVEARDKARKELMDRDRLNLDRQRFMQGVLDAQLNREYQGRAAIWGNEQAKQREADRQRNVLAAQRNANDLDLARLGLVNEFKAKDRAADLEMDIAAEKRGVAARIEDEKRAWDAKVKEAERARVLAIEMAGLEAVEKGADERLKFVEENEFSPEMIPTIQKMRAELAKIRSDPHNAKATHPKAYAAWMQQWLSQFDNLRLAQQAKRPQGLADQYGKAFLAFDQNGMTLPSFNGAKYALVPNGYKFEDVAGKGGTGGIDQKLLTEARNSAIQKKATSLQPGQDPMSAQNPTPDEIAQEYTRLQVEQAMVQQRIGGGQPGPQAAPPQVTGVPQQAPAPQQGQPQPGQPQAAPPQVQIPQTPPSYGGQNPMASPQGQQEYEQHLVMRGVEDARDPRKIAWARDYYADIQRRYPNLQSLDMLPRSERDSLDRALRILKGIAILQQQQQQGS